LEYQKNSKSKDTAAVSMMNREENYTERTSKDQERRNPRENQNCAAANESTKESPNIEQCIGRC